MADRPVPPIRSFRDALGFALELADRHPRAAAAALLEPGGRAVELAVAPSPDASIEPVVAWAAGSGGWDGRPRSVLVVSIRAFDPDVVREADLRRYRRIGWSLARAGRPLADWIETDGDLVRSYAYLTHPAEAWAGDPPAHRADDVGDG